jgi:hypothetical protein
MTVGLYINQPAAIMISDCLALPSQKGMQSYSPSNIELFDGKNGEYAKLVSKFIQADESTLIAFAGRSDHITEFVEEFPRHWEKRDPDLRPMQFLMELDYKLRDVRPCWQCSVLGASVIPAERDGESDIVNNYASFNDNWKFSTNHFGECYAIGSGSGELRQFFENADKQLHLYGPMDDSALFKCLGALNGKALFAQQRDIAEQTWGGLLQCQAFHPTERRWLRTPAWFHMCVFFEGKDLAFKGIHKKTVLHTSKPGDANTSVIVTNVLNDDGKTETIVWPVYSPFIAPERRKPIQINEVFKIPNQITITEYIDVDGRCQINHSTYHLDTVKGVKFEKDGDSFEFNINPNEFSEWLRQELIDASLPSILK